MMRAIRNPSTQVETDSFRTETMFYTELGRTGLHVSQIGFGASPLGNVFGDVPTTEGDRAVACAVDLGINLFDVSPYYGATLAETRLGSALRGRRKSVVLATKCGRYGPDAFDFSAATIELEFDASLRRLQTDYVDILQVHDIEFGSFEQIVNETVPALQRLQQQGKVRFIGATSYWPGLLAKLLQAVPLDCVLNYCHANLFVDDMLSLLEPAAAAAGVELLNASPLHMGLLSNAPIPEWHPAPPAVREAAQQVRSVAGEFGIDAGTLALRFALGNASVTSTFVGIRNEAEVRASVAALHAGIPDALLHLVGTIVAPVHNTLWPSGRPENYDVTFEPGKRITR